MAQDDLKYFAPTIDTRPLGPADLSEGQIETIERLNGQLNTIITQNGALGDGWRLGGDPFSTLLPQRSHRVVLLDGIRGTGKTSLLLTLLRYWQPTSSGVANAPPSRRRQRRGGDPWLGQTGWKGAVKAWEGTKPHTVEARSIRLYKLFDDNHSPAKHIHPLPGLDLDPLPKGLGVHALLLSAFGSLVESLSATGSTPRRDAQWEQWETQSSETTNLDTAYRQVQRDAVGAESEVFGKADDLDLAVRQRNDKDRRWIGLRRRYWDFVECLLERMGDHEHQKLLVVSIDDLDLNDRHADDVLQAMRLLWHPQVVFLATGHYHGLIEGVHLCRLRDELAVARLEGKDQYGRSQEERTRELAERVVEKTLPISHRLEVPPGPSLPQLLLAAAKFVTGVDSPIAADWLYELPTDRSNERRALNLFLRRAVASGVFDSRQSRGVFIGNAWCGLTFRQFVAFRSEFESSENTGLSEGYAAWALLLRWAEKVLPLGIDPERPRYWDRITPEVARRLGLGTKITGLAARSAYGAALDEGLKEGARSLNWADDIALMDDKGQSIGLTNSPQSADRLALVFAAYIHHARGYPQIKLPLPGIARASIREGGQLRTLNWPDLPPVSLVFVERYLALRLSLGGETKQPGDGGWTKDNPWVSAQRSNENGTLLAFLIRLLTDDRMTPGLGGNDGDLGYFGVDPTHRFGKQTVEADTHTASKAGDSSTSLLKQAVRDLIIYARRDPELRTWVKDSIPRLGHLCYGLDDDARATLLDTWFNELSTFGDWRFSPKDAWTEATFALHQEGLIDGFKPDPVARWFTQTLEDDSVFVRALRQDQSPVVPGSPPDTSRVPSPLDESTKTDSNATPWSVWLDSRFETVSGTKIRPYDVLVHAAYRYQHNASGSIVRGLALRTFDHAATADFGLWQRAWGDKLWHGVPQRRDINRGLLALLDLLLDQPDGDAGRKGTGKRASDSQRAEAKELRAMVAMTPGGQIRIAPDSNGRALQLVPVSTDIWTERLRFPTTPPIRSVYSWRLDGEIQESGTGTVESAKSDAESIFATFSGKDKSSRNFSHGLMGAWVCFAQSLLTAIDPSDSGIGSNLPRLAIEHFDPLGSDLPAPSFFPSWHEYDLFSVAWHDAVLSLREQEPPLSEIPLHGALFTSFLRAVAVVCLGTERGRFEQPIPFDGRPESVVRWGILISLYSKESRRWLRTLTQPGWLDGTTWESMASIEVFAKWVGAPRVNRRILQGLTMTKQRKASALIIDEIAAANSGGRPFNFAVVSEEVIQAIVDYRMEAPKRAAQRSNTKGDEELGGDDT